MKFRGCLLLIRKRMPAGSILPLQQPEILDSRFLGQKFANCFQLSDTESKFDANLGLEGILMEDALLLSRDELRGMRSVDELRRYLYGEVSFPILRKEFRERIPRDASSSELRRQYLIERLATSKAIFEYRILAASMVQRGMLNSVNDLNVRAMWRQWMAALTARVSEELEGGVRDNSPQGSVSRRARECLVQTRLSAEKIATIACIGAVSEICRPSSSRSTISGRSTKGVDDDIFAVQMRKWTNLDIASALEAGDVGGRATFVQVCEVLASAVLFEANCHLPSPLPWAPADRLTVGAELSRMLLTECFMGLDGDKAMTQAMLPPPSPTSPFTVNVQSELLRLENEPAPAHPALRQPGSNVMVHAFEHTVENRGFKSVGYISLRPELVEALSKVVPSNSFMKLAPMVIQPVPWRGFWRCGYATRRSPLIRFTGTRDAARDSAVSDLSSVRKCMDYLGSTEWAVNGAVLDWVERGMEAKGVRIPGLPYQAEKPAKRVPKRIDRGNPSSPAIPISSAQHRTRLMQQLRDKQKSLCELPTLMSKLDVARDFRNAQVLYFPHSIDFRGRAYPIPAPFNHQGDDMTRALLRFREAKVLGNSGWFWLRVHAANLLGQDKVSLVDRVAWTEANLHAIVAFARDPLAQESIDFIAPKTEDFWQALAVSIEITQALDHEGGPTLFPSSLPIHQDGSCNGLQHYAALGRDQQGGAAVNLLPTGTVADVYTVVLEIVKQRVALDAAKFEDLVTEELLKQCPTTYASLKEGKAKAALAQVALHFGESVLQRKIVKQTVMTICYGVTQIGASDQIHKQLSDLPIATKLSSSQLSVLASYLARLTLTSIDTVFADAMGIKRWFDQVAREVNRNKLSINWISLAGVPCRQPYRKSVMMEIRTPVQKLTVVSEADADHAPLSAAKQRMGFPPNFIHSLDASHMMLTALECQKAGLTFAAVHDSFWTHAADVDSMNKAIRDQFLQMYSQPILERLRDSIVVHLGAQGNKIPPLPKQGDLDLTHVLDSPYFFD